ncbi:MAG: phosphoadenylyl-sulfate reductase [Mariprofundaceae bacterium]
MSARERCSHAEHVLQAIDLLQQAKREHGDKLVYPCSLGAEGMVLIDMIASHAPGIRILTLDTGRLPQSTYDLMDKVRAHYGMHLDVVFPDAPEVEAMVTRHGLNLFYDSVEMRQMCCEIRKVRPLRRAMTGMEAWITGRLRSQSLERADIQAVENDRVFGLKKYNPLHNWSWQQIWGYIRAFDVPYNRLHDEHFVSIGCEPCTRAIAVGEDVRAGRWWWEIETASECGLHMNPIRADEEDGNEQGGGI